MCTINATTKGLCNEKDVDVEKTWRHKRTGIDKLYWYCYATLNGTVVGWILRKLNLMSLPRPKRENIDSCGNLFVNSDIHRRKNVSTDPCILFTV